MAIHNTSPYTVYRKHYTCHSANTTQHLPNPQYITQLPHLQFPFNKSLIMYLLLLA